MKDKLVYLSHNKKNIKILRAVISIMSRDNPRICILSPKLMFSHLTGEDYMENCLTLLDMCDEMWAVGGIKNCENYEAEYCRKYNIPVNVVRR